MNLTESVNNYCERTGPEFWSEPVNAATNLAFIIAALIAYLMWRRKTPDDWVALSLIGIVFLTGVGSFLFHTFATRWAAVVDVLPIVLFIHIYLLVALRRYLALPWVIAVAIVIGFGVLSPMVGEVWAPLMGTSAFYLPALLAFFSVGGFFYSKNRELGRDVLITGIIFAISVTFRTLDMSVCAQFVLGTHFLWHILNGVVLFSLLRILIRHRIGYST